jgi:DNA-binding MarR family transcriptional regulator
MATTKPEPRAALDIGVLRSLIGFNLRMAQLAVYDDFLRGAPLRGLTPGQLAILVLIDRNPNTTQQRLSQRIGIEKSTLVVRLHRLADRGLVERVRSTEDRRENALRLTPRGRAALASMLEFITRHERKIAAALSADERRQLITLLRKIAGEGPPKRDSARTEAKPTRWARRRPAKRPVSS